MSPEITHLARITLVSFLLTFILVRTLVYLLNSGKVRNVFVQVKGTHIHHLNFGILILAGVSGYLLFWTPAPFGLDTAAAGYGIGMALTFDEFGMWLHLEDNYWQRASWDAIGVVASLLALIAFAPSIYDFRLNHWVVAGIVTLAVVYFFAGLYLSIRARFTGGA